MSNYYLSEQIHSLNIPQFCVVFNIINLHNVQNHDNYFKTHTQFLYTPETFENLDGNNFFTQTFYRDRCDIYVFSSISYNQTSQIISTLNILFKEDIIFLFVSENMEFLDSLQSEIADSSFLALSIAHTPGIYINLETLETTFICIPCQENDAYYENSKIHLKNAPHLKIPFANVLGLATMGYGGPHCYREKFRGLYFGRIPNECRGYLTAISIMAGKLNLTLELDPFFDDENPNPFTIMQPLIVGLHLLPMFQDVLKTGGNFGINAPVAYLLYYCVPYSRFMRPDWAIFLEPFQTFVWAAVILVVAGVCLLVQTNLKITGGSGNDDPLQYYTYEMIRSGLFVLKGDPDKHICTNLKAIPLLVIALFSYNFLQPEYLGRVTSAFITPGSVEEVRDLYTLMIHRGYKLHFKTDNIINNLDIVILNLRMRGNEINRETQITVWNDDSKNKHLFEYLCEVRNIEKTQESVVLSKMLGRGDNFVVGGVKCVILFETEFVVNKVYVAIKYFKGRDMLKVFVQLQETGFEKFWRQVESWGSGKYWRDIGNRVGSGVKSLSVYSHIQILLYIFLISEGIAGVVFFWEIWSRRRCSFGFSWKMCYGSDVVILF